MPECDHVQHLSSRWLTRHRQLQARKLDDWIQWMHFALCGWTFPSCGLKMFYSKMFEGWWHLFVEGSCLDKCSHHFLDSIEVEINSPVFKRPWHPWSEDSCANQIYNKASAKFVHQQGIWVILLPPATTYHPKVCWFHALSMFKRIDWVRAPKREENPGDLDVVWLFRVNSWEFQDSDLMLSSMQLQNICNLTSILHQICVYKRLLIVARKVARWSYNV